MDEIFVWKVYDNIRGFECYFSSEKKANDYIHEYMKPPYDDMGYRKPVRFTVDDKELIECYWPYFYCKELLVFYNGMRVESFGSYGRTKTSGVIALKKLDSEIVVQNFARDDFRILLKMENIINFVQRGE